MTLKETIAYRIEQLCKEKKMNLSSLAYLCGMDRSTIYSTPEFDLLEQKIK